MELLYSIIIKVMIGMISVFAGQENFTCQEINSSSIIQKNAQIQLLNAAYAGDLQEVEKFLNEGVPINSSNLKGDTPLILATGQGHLSVATFLINKNAAIDLANLKGLTPLHWASMKGHLNVITALINHGCNINKQDNKGYTPLYWACLNDHAAIAALLISRGAYINLPGQKGITPLHEASYQGKREIVKLLIEKGAVIQQSNSEGLTALHFAALNGDYAMTDLLIQLGAEINQQTHDGFSPLHYAAAHGQVKILDLLLQSGCHINLRDKSGRSSLLLAILNGEKEAVNFLINSGANINQADIYGNYPILMAARVGDTEIAELLIEAHSEVLPGMIDHESQEMTPLYFVRMFRKKNHKSLAKLFKTRCPKLSEIEKEHIHLKRLGHAWKIDGSYTVQSNTEGYPTMTLRILGGRSNQFYRTMAKGTQNYTDTCGLYHDDTVYQELYEMLSFGDELYEHEAAEIMDRILQGKPTPIHIGWSEESHQVELLIWKDKLIFSNRGLGSRTPIEIYHFDPYLLTEDNIQRILDLDGLSKEQFENELFFSIAKDIQLKKGPFEKLIESNISLSFQTVDNCAWESTEGIAYAFFLLGPFQTYMQNNENERDISHQQVKKMLKTQEQLFSKWLLFQQLDVLDRYIVHHNEEDTPYELIEGLVSQIMIKIQRKKEIASDKCLSLKLDHIKAKLKSSTKG